MGQGKTACCKGNLYNGLCPGNMPIILILPGKQKLIKGTGVREKQRIGPKHHHGTPNIYELL